MTSLERDISGTMDKELIKEMRKAIKSNDIEKVKELLGNNSNLLETETPFGTFLHDAATYGMYDMAKLLVESGIDVNKKGGVRDSSALTAAAFRGYIRIVELLYENGAALDTSTFSRNPLFATISEGHIDVVRFLVEKGIDLKADYAIGDLEHVDAYEYARQYGQTEIANYLKEL